MLHFLDLLLRGVGMIGIWCITASWHVTLWVAEVAIKIAWTLFMCVIEFWLIMFSVVFLTRHFKK